MRVADRFGLSRRGALPTGPGAPRRPPRASAALIVALAAIGATARAQDRIYFVTYDHRMEEPGSLEVSFNPVYATQRGGGDFFAHWLEFEYGVKGWWTTELYLDGQSTRHDSSVFTGLRWENRFRLLMEEHAVNPVVYVEIEDVNGADKTMLEVVGHDVESDHAVANAEGTREHEREVETKLILSSDVGAWNVSENLIAEKNLGGEPWEFGYAVGASRPLALAARPERCTLCLENFTVGIEMYGGLGDAESVGLKDTSHYLAPVVAWSLPSGLTLRLSPGFGLNRNSHRFLLRFGASFETRIGGGS